MSRIVNPSASFPPLLRQDFGFEISQSPAPPRIGSILHPEHCPELSVDDIILKINDVDAFHLSGQKALELLLKTPKRFVAKLLIGRYPDDVSHDASNASAEGSTTAAATRGSTKPPAKTADEGSDLDVYDSTSDDEEETGAEKAPMRPAPQHDDKPKKVASDTSSSSATSTSGAGQRSDAKFKVASTNAKTELADSAPEAETVNRPAAAPRKPADLLRQNSAMSALAAAMSTGLSKSASAAAVEDDSTTAPSATENGSAVLSATAKAGGKPQKPQRRSSRGVAPAHAAESADNKGDEGIVAVKHETENESDPTATAASDAADGGGDAQKPVQRRKQTAMVAPMADAEVAPEPKPKAAPRPASMVGGSGKPTVARRASVAEVPAKPTAAEPSPKERFVAEERPPSDLDTTASPAMAEGKTRPAAKPTLARRPSLGPKPALSAKPNISPKPEGDGRDGRPAPNPRPRSRTMAS